MKSKEQTDAEILNSAKTFETITTIQEIRIRNSSSCHPIQCFCSIHRDMNLRKNPSAQAEFNAKANPSLDWIRP